MGESINKAIADRVVWITRPTGQCENLCHLVESAGGRAIRFPVIKIIPVRQQRDLSEISREVLASDLVIFVSRNAVDFVDSAVPDFYKIISGKQVLAIGEGTRTALCARGIEDAISPESGIGSEALLELEQLHPDVSAGRSILVVRGVGGRDRIRQALERSGAAVKYLEVYERRKPDTDIKTLEDIWHATPPDVIVVTSVEGLNNLINMTPGDKMHRLLQTQLVVMSDRIRSVALSLGFTAGPAVAGHASDEGLLAATISIFENRTV